MFIQYVSLIDEVRRACKDYNERIARLEDEKYDLEYVVKRKDAEVLAEQGPLTFGNSQDLLIFASLLLILFILKCRAVSLRLFNQRLNCWLLVSCIFLSNALLKLHVTSK